MALDETSNAKKQLATMKLTESESILKMLHWEPSLEVVIVNGKLLKSVVKRFISIGQLPPHLVLVQVQLLQAAKFIITQGNLPCQFIS